MRRSARKWLYQTAALLVGGVVVLVLLPGGPPTANRVGAVATSTVTPAAATPVAATEPVHAPASEVASISPAAIVPASTPVATAAATASASVSAAGADYLKPAPIASSTTAPPVAAQLPEPAASVVPVAAVAPAQAAPDAAQPADTASLPGGRIGGTAVNARSGPAADAGKVFVLAAGESVKVGETTAGWTHVYRQNGESGWVYRRYLAGQNAPDAPQLATRDSGRQAAQSQPNDPTGRMARVRSPVPVRSAPGEYAAMVFVLEPGERVRITEARGQWLRVLTEDGDSGWIPA